MDCSSHQPKLVATGISPLGIVSVGVVPMGIIAIGVVPMGVISLGVVSMGVIVLHSAVLLAMFWPLSVQAQLYLTLVAYAAYVVNAAQFLWKFRLARQDGAGRGS